MIQGEKGSIKTLHDKKHIIFTPLSLSKKKLRERGARQENSGAVGGQQRRRRYRAGKVNLLFFNFF